MVIEVFLNHLIKSSYTTKTIFPAEVLFRSGGCKWWFVRGDAPGVQTLYSSWQTGFPHMY
jgi:hypothetical protein